MNTSFRNLPEPHKLKQPMRHYIVTVSHANSASGHALEQARASPLNRNRKLMNPNGPYVSRSLVNKRAVYVEDDLLRKDELIVTYEGSITSMATNSWPRPRLNFPLGSAFSGPTGTRRSAEWGVMVDFSGNGISFTVLNQQLKISKEIRSCMKKFWSHSSRTMGGGYERYYPPTPSQQTHRGNED